MPRVSLDTEDQRQRWRLLGWNPWHSTDLPGTDQSLVHSSSSGDMEDAEMKTSHFPSIPFVASRDPTMVRCRVRHVSIGTLETSCHRSDSRSRNSSDPFPELSPKKRTIQAAATLSALSFLEFFTRRQAPISMGAPFPLIDSSLSVMVTTTTTQYTRFAMSVPQLGSEYVSLPFVVPWEMIKVHIINSKRKEMLYSIPLFRGICRGIRTLNTMRRVIHQGPYSTYHAATTWRLTPYQRFSVILQLTSTSSSPREWNAALLPLSHIPPSQAEVPPHAYC